MNNNPAWWGTIICSIGFIWTSVILLMMRRMGSYLIRRSFHDPDCKAFGATLIFVILWIISGVGAIFFGFHITGPVP